MEENYGNGMGLDRDGDTFAGLRPPLGEPGRGGERGAGGGPVRH